MKSTKALLLGVTLDSDNRGIGALAMGALSILVHRYQDCDIRFVDYAQDATTTCVQVSGRKISVPLINLRFSKKLWLPNNIAWLMLLAAVARVAGPRLRTKIFAGNAWLNQLAEADIAVAVSGGDSFSDIYGLGRFFYMALPQLLVLLLDRPLVLLPQTIGPTRTVLARWIVRFIIEHSEISYSRDVDGVKAAIESLKIGREPNALRFGYDMGFILEARKPAHMDLPGLEPPTTISRPLVGVNVSGLLIMGGYDGKNMFDLQCDYQELIELVVKQLIEKRGATVLLVPHVFGTEPESDTVAIERIYSKLKDRYPTRLFRVTAPYDQSEIKYVIGQCDMFIGSRMHACIAALSQGVPAVGIAYSQKFAGVLASVGASHLVADPRHASIEQIVRMVDTTFSDQAAIRSSLTSTMVDVKRKALNVLVDAT